MNNNPPPTSRQLGQRLISSACALLTVSLLAALAAPTRSLAQAPTFNALVTTYTNASYNFPNGATAGDFNGDGKLDVLVPDNGAIRMMLGNGDGSFTEHDLGIQGGGNIRAADLNGDGRLDVVLVRPQGDLKPVVLLNTGNDANGVPQFSATSYTAVYGGLRSITIGDLNGDGKPDFIVGSAYASLQVYLNNGDGTFTAGPAYSLTPGAGGPSVGPGVIADFNGDGKADYLVTSNQNGGANLLLGNGDGSFQAPVFIANTPDSVAIAAADLNGDGKPDFVVGNADGTVGIFLNSGGGSFSGPTLYTTVAGGSPWSVAIADMNNDGKLDVVATNFNSFNGTNGVAVLLGNGNGTLGAATTYTTSQRPFYVSTGDFNGDGKPDIATATYNSKDVGVLLNTTPAALPTQTLTVLGGSGTVGGVAANVEYYNPATGNWQPTFLTGGHPWGFVSGTNSWINYKQSNLSDPWVSDTRLNPTWYLYRVRFTVPADAVNPKMTFSVKADNWAQILINGVNAGPAVAGGLWFQVTDKGVPIGLAVEGGTDQVNADAIFSQNVRPGENVITLNVGDWGGLNGFNFRIDLSMQSSQPLVIVPAAPPDTTPPIITAPSSVTAEATSAAGAVVAFTATGYDAVSGPVAVVAVPASGSTFPIATTIVGLAASDAARNTATASFTVTVRDTTAPVIANVPASIVAEATGASGAPVGYTAATATDAVGVTLLASSPASGSTFSLGSTPVSITAKDAAGNASSAGFTVTVRDTTRPVVTVPASQTLEATGAAGAVATFAAASATDAVGVTSLTTSAASGSTFALGTTTVTVTAKDAAGNTGTGAFTIKVQDTTAPALTLPASQVLEATGAAGAVATFTATATDAVGVTAVTYSAASGSTFALGTTTVTVTAKDAAGNTTSGTFTVKVVDTTAPTITSLGNNSPTLWPPNHKMVAVTVAASAADTVGVASLKIVSVTSSEPDNGLGDGDTAGDIEITGALTLNLRAERSGGGNGRTYTITVQAKDAAGNATTKTTTVFVPKSQSGK